jgi:heptosyltransferase-2
MLDKRRMPRMIDRFVALTTPADGLAEISEYPSLAIDDGRRELLIEKLGLKTDRPVVGLCPGAEYGDAKRWPEAHFAALASTLVQAGITVWIFGGNADKSAAHKILDTMGMAERASVVDLTGETSLLDVIDIMGLCKCIVSNDSGLMHIASAVGCHTIVLYGSTSPDFTPPLTERVDIVNLELDCSPCFKRTCPLVHKNCLNEMLPDRISPLVTRVVGVG